MIEARIEFSAVMGSLRRSAAVMQDTRPLMGSVAGIMMRAVEDNFEQEGRPKWQDLKPSTKLARSLTGNWPGKVLQRTGRLASSMVTSHDARTAAVGSNVVYAAINFFGGRTRPHVIQARNKRALAFGGIVVRRVNHPGSQIPARNALRMTPRDLRDIVESSRDFYNKALARNGLLTR